MAVYNLDKYLESDGLGFPKNFRRGNPNPLDNSSVWASFEAAQNYAKNSAIAYVGQELAVVDIENNLVKFYGIQDEAGTLKEIGIAPIGDNKTISIDDDGKVQLYGINTITDTTKKYQPIFDNGVLTWVELDTTNGNNPEDSVKSLEEDVSELQETVYGKEASEGTEAVVGLIDKVSENTTGIADINNKIGTVAEGKTLVEMIADAESNATYDDTTIINRIKAIEDDHLKSTDKTELLQTISTAKEEAKNEAIATILGENVNADFDTLKEIAEWITSDTTQSSELITRVSNIEKYYLKGADKTELQNAIDELERFVGSIPEGSTSTNVIAYISEAINNLKIGDYAKASELSSLADRVTLIETDVAELKNIGAEKNIIDLVDTDQFAIDENRKLTLLDIAMNKVTGLSDALNGKVDKIDGHRLISQDEAEKLSKIVLNDDNTAEVNAKIDATNVKELDSWITSNRDNVPGLLSTIDAAILENIKDVEVGAEVNDIIAITLGDNKTALPITDRVVNIPTATAEQYGVVRSSAVENKVSVAADGTMEVNAINVNKLTQTDGEYLILNGGSSSTIL